MKNENELKKIVKEKYGAIAAGTDISCCGNNGCCGGTGATELTNFAEPYAGLDGYEESADLGLGCGLPTEWAGIETGQTVLDLGSGAGNDVFVARALTGETGRVIGVDMVPEMIAKAKENAERLDAKNVEILLGEIEDLPLPDASVDVVVSNCVLNLVPDKARAFAEIHRVLKPGGHFCISDIVLEGELPAELAEAAALYAGCVTGALQRQKYLGVIGGAGFEGVTVRSQRRLDIPDSLLSEHLDTAAITAWRAGGAGIFSVTVVAYRQRYIDLIWSQVAACEDMGGT